MKHRQRLLFAFCLVLAFASASSAAKMSPSHRDLPDAPRDAQGAEELLARRLGQTRDMNKLDDLARKLLQDFKPENLSAEDLQKLQKIADKYKAGKALDLKDPEIANIIKDPKFGKLLKKIKPDDLSPDVVAGLEKLRKQPEGEAPDLNDPQVSTIVRKLFEKQKTDSTEDNKLEELLKQLPQPEPAPEPDLSVLPTRTDPKQPATDEKKQQNRYNEALMYRPPAESSWLNKQLLNLAETVNDLDGGAKDSLGSLLTDLAKGGDGKASKGTSFFENLSKIGDSVPTDKVKDAGSWIGKLTASSLSSFSPAPPPPNGTSAGIAPGSLGVVHVCLGVFIILVVGAIAWRLLTAYKIARTHKASDLWKLGSWPVQPSAVQTRADLVKAFEYLAVLCLGPSAQTRNHLELGADIGRQAPVDDARRTEAARTLAHLYEIARYAPAAETLPPDELATARRELSFLAGAASA